jgi:AcrR family transcriptional regulator
MASASSSAVDADLPATPRERLLLEAARLFRMHGYAGTSTRTLAEAIGITKASLYHHVRSKDALLLEICLESLARINHAVETAVHGHTDSLDRLRAAVLAHVASALDDADMHATMLIEMRALSPEGRQQVRGARAAYEARLRGLLEDAHGDHYLRPELETKWLTLSLLNMLNWSIFWYHPDGGLEPQQIGQTLLDIYMNGAVAAPQSTRAKNASSSSARPAAAAPSISQLDRLERKLDQVIAGLSS